MCVHVGMAKWEIWRDELEENGAPLDYYMDIVATTQHINIKKANDNNNSIIYID